MIVFRFSGANYVNGWRRVSRTSGAAFEDEAGDGAEQGRGVV